MKVCVLAAVDFSDVTLRVAKTAARLAQALGLPMYLLHVAAPDPDFVGYEPGPQSVREAVAKHLRDQHAQLQQLATASSIADLQIQALVVQGVPADKIIEHAGKLNAKLLVIGSHGHGALHQLLLGSVSEQLVREAPCALVIENSRQRQ